MSKKKKKLKNDFIELEEEKELKTDTTSLSVIDTTELNDLIDEDLGVKKEKKVSGKKHIFVNIILIILLIISLISFSINVLNSYISISTLISNSIISENILLNYLNKDEEEFDIENNDTLIISEPLGKVILPYTAKEVMELFIKEPNTYKSIEDVIEQQFTRKLSDYRFQATSRYKETMKLVTEREKYNLLDGITLAFEMFRKRYLHPAIISACRNLDELDVYLDCLDKNELDDFKIFQVKYELYPLVIKKRLFSKTRQLVKNNDCKDNSN